jgi:cytidyltransferase-like protein
MSKKKVFVTGCFDMLHSGHVAFLKEAASYGELYVGIGSDANIYNLKGRYPVNNQAERKYMIESLACVKKCFVNSGWDIIDFEKELETVKPEVFVVNEDGNSPHKEELAAKYGFEYVVLKRIPFDNLPVRSTTSLRRECTMPYRIDLAGGWLDQPYVGRYASGPVITVSIEPTVEFNERSGMASSTRRKAIELWTTDIPEGNKEKLARILFSYENSPGTKIIAGSQDSLGIVMPGLNRLDYAGQYWPKEITTVNDEQILSWIESHLYLATLGPRESGYDVLDNTRINEENAENLALAAKNCWNAILEMNLQKFGCHFKESFEAQIAMFPNMVDGSILKIINRYKNHSLGYKLSGAGGGGYLIMVSDKPVRGAMRIKIRRRGI